MLLTRASFHSKFLNYIVWKTFIYHFSYTSDQFFVFYLKFLQSFISHINLNLNFIYLFINLFSLILLCLLFFWDTNKISLCFLLFINVNIIIELCSKGNGRAGIGNLFVTLSNAWVLRMAKLLVRITHKWFAGYTSTDSAIRYCQSLRMRIDFRMNLPV